jgi:hypothetical protein
LTTQLRALCGVAKVSAGRKPHVEVGGMYPGVRVRGITHVVDRDRFVEMCDMVYNNVMGLPED